MAQGHWVAATGTICTPTLLEPMRFESPQAGLVWKNIFNTEAPWARRAEDGPGRQATYAGPEVPLPALRARADAVMAAMAAVPAAEHLVLGTVG